MALEFWLTQQPIGNATGAPRALQLADGNIMVVYSANGQNGANYRIFDPFGDTVTSGNLFPDANVGHSVKDLIPRDDGGFTLLYATNNDAGPGLRIQDFDAAGQPTSAPFIFGTDFSGGTNDSARFVELPGGGYAVGYNFFGPGQDFWDVKFILIDGDGNVGDPLDVDANGPGRQFDPRVETNGDNLFISWRDDTDQQVIGQILGLDGAPLGNEFLIHSTTTGEYRDPQIGVFSNGNYVVTFTATDAPGADSESGSARARLFSPTGVPLGDEFVLNEEAGGFQGAPNVTVLPDDSFMVSYFGPGGGHRWFNADGTPRTDTLQSGLPLSQTSLVTLGDGRFAAFGVDSSLFYEIIDGRMGQLDGDEGDNVLISTREGDTTINGFGGDDIFYGNNDDDTFIGGEGNDTFRGQLGQDTFIGGPGDDVYYFTPFSVVGENRTEIIEEAGEGTDTLYNYGFLFLPNNIENGILVEDAGTAELAGNNVNNTLIGNSFDNILAGFFGNDTLIGGAGDDRLKGGDENDTIDGGEGNDVAVYRGDIFGYDIRAVAGTQSISVATSGFDGVDTVTNVEILSFKDIDVLIDQGDGLSIDPANDDPRSFMFNIRDFDGNELGGADSWVRIGAADANLDGNDDIIFVNRVNGRFAEVGVDENGLVQFANHGQGGDTRVVGIYIDPLVQSGDVEQGSPFDSQQRFQNDLFIGNIAQVLGSQDYDGDGFAEIYFALTDGTAYLRALMHADGNIQYANYQSEQQVRDYLTANGYGEETFGTWFGGNGEAASSPIMATHAGLGMMWQPQDMAVVAEVFG